MVCLTLTDVSDKMSWPDFRFFHATLQWSGIGTPFCSTFTQTLWQQANRETNNELKHKKEKCF